MLFSSLGALHSSGTSECFRCVTLQPRSRNVIELLAESLDKCYMTEEVAQSNCPDERSKNRSFSRIILYSKCTSNDLPEKIIDCLLNTFLASNCGYVISK